MSPLTRRAFLAGVACACAAPRGPRADPELARAFVGATPAGAMARAVQAANAGAAPEEILAAVTRAAVVEIPPRPYLGPEFHAVMVLPAVARAIRAASGREAYRPVLFAVDL